MSTYEINTEQFWPKRKRKMGLKASWDLTVLEEQIFYHLCTMYALFFQQNSNGMQVLQSYVETKKKK